MRCSDLPQPAIRSFEELICGIGLKGKHRLSPALPLSPDTGAWVHRVYAKVRQPSFARIHWQQTVLCRVALAKPRMLSRSLPSLPQSYHFSGVQEPLGKITQINVDERFVFVQKT